MAGYIKEHSLLIIGMLMLALVGMGMYFGCGRSSQGHMPKFDDVSYTDERGVAHEIYHDGEVSELKRKNRELYDSIKAYKDKLSYAVQFTHEKRYSSGVVAIKDTSRFDTARCVPMTYEYHSEPNDTFQYTLKVNSDTEPNWYSLSASVRNRFTIVNKDQGGGLSHLTVSPDDGGTVSDVTVFKKSEKRGFSDRLSVGPGITAGYDPVNRRLGVVVGVSVSFDLW